MSKTAFLCLAILLISNTAGAQATKASNARGPIQVSQMVSPSFKVTPMVQRFESHRGKSIQFEFVMSSSVRATHVEVMAVALKQDESGVILPADQPLTSGQVKIQTETDFILPANEERPIRGEIKVPGTDTTFHSFGILVRDFGVESDDSTAPASGDQPRVRLKFITQYLCRCDITIAGARAADISKLVIEKGEMVETMGSPQARVYVSNPTDSPFEFEVKCRVIPAASTLRRKQFNLIMPSRASQDDEQRNIARILPHARVRLEAISPEPVFDGDYQLDADLISGGRVVNHSKTTLALKGDDYPAQAIRVVQASPGVSVSPAQIELSSQRGGDRIQTITINNQNTERALVRLTPTTAEGRPADWLTIRPAEVEVPGGGSRKVSVSLTNQRDVADHRFGHIAVASEIKGTKSIQEAKLLTAVLGKARKDSQLRFVDLQFDPLAKTPTFIVKVINEGNAHSVLEGKITLADEAGQMIHLYGGYGRWLLPGESQVLNFPLAAIPAAGNYQMRTEIKFSDTHEPLARVDNIRLAIPAISDNKAQESNRK